MAKIAMRERAQSLRSAGTSIREIARVLSASKSTVSYWCRDIILTASQVKRLTDGQKQAARATLLEAAEKKRLTRIENTAQEMKRGARDVGRMDKRDLLILGLALYWGEGYQRGNEELGFTNSNSHIVSVFIAWLREIYGVQKSNLIFRVSINGAHKNRMNEVVKHWADFIGVPTSQFTQTSIIKTASHKLYSNPENHFGTLRIKARRGTALRRRILGSIYEMARQIPVRVRWR